MLECACVAAGVAVSDDGINWQRSAGNVEGNRTAQDVGACLESDQGDWWTLDTCAVAVADVQMFASANVSGGSGLYWMFYTGCDFQPVKAPQGLPGMIADEEVEGLCARPGLAMSQVTPHHHHGDVAVHTHAVCVSQGVRLETVASGRVLTCMQDGRNWARIEADHHTHALFDRGEEGEWDSLFAAGPQVVAAGPKDMRLYYHSFDASQGRYRIGLATSEDGFTCASSLGYRTAGQSVLLECMSVASWAAKLSPLLQVGKARAALFRRRGGRL